MSESPQNPSSDTLAARRGIDDRRLASRVLLEWSVTATVTVLLVLWMVLSRPSEQADNLLYDAFSSLSAPTASSDIAIVSIDERSLEALGPWPWPRSIHAELIGRLEQAKAAHVAYDVLFIEPSPHDDQLADAILSAGNIHLPALLTAPGPAGASYEYSPPAGELASAAAGIGHVLLTADADGTVRHLPLWLLADDRAFAHMLLPIHMQTNGRAHTAPSLPIGSGGLIEGQPTLIRYPARNSGYHTLSFIDVLRGEVSADFIRDKVVLVGATAQGMGDRYATASSIENELIPGVEIQAALLQTLQQDNAIRIVPIWVQLALGLLPLLAVMTAFLWLRPATNTWLGLAAVISIILLSALLLQLGWWWPPIAAICGILLAWPLWSWRRLAASFRYMQAELDTIRDDTTSPQLSALSPVPVWQQGDPISRRMLELSSLLHQGRDFNRYVTQSLRILPDAAVITDNASSVLVANERAHGLFDTLEPEGQSLSTLFALLGQPDASPYLKGEHHDDLITPDGRAIQVATARLTMADGQYAGQIVRFADVTQMRLSERQRERTLQLLGHDMRAPQVSILTLLDSADRSSAFEKRIRANARQTLDLAEGYVQLSRAESQTLKLEPVDLANLLVEAADMMWPQAAAKGIDLLSPTPEDVIFIAGDASLLRRCLVNLLDNAIRHTGTGGKVFCDILPSDDRIILTIADEGEGFDPDIRANLFKPYQGGKIAGAGLGLAFVHTVIQRHGGHISLDPPEGFTPPTNGATFYLILPPALDID